MEIRAAVVEAEGGPFEVEPVELEAPRADEVLVRVVGAGVCHTDMIVRDQLYPTPLPAVLGHEGSGVVESVGEDVTAVEPGDRVVMSFDYDGTCRTCRDGHPAYCADFFAHNFGGARPEDGTSPLSRDGEPISGRFFGQSSFATHAVATERNVVPVEDDVPLELLGPLGCGIQTGAGGVINSLDPQAGSSIAVFGAGSVGLSAVMAAGLKGCTEIVAVELKAGRREKAAELGATGTVDPGAVDDVVETVREQTDGGVDYALETTGVPDVAEQAVDVLTQRGTLGIIGAPALGTEASYDVNDLIINGRSITGIVEGDSDPQQFIPDLVELYRQGAFPFDELVTYYDFEEIERAVGRAVSGPVSERLREAFWTRHSNPWSAGTRILASPVLIYAIYAIYARRRRLLAAVVAFLVVNPVLFPRPVRTDNWLSRGVLAEREWIGAGRGTVGLTYPNVLNLLSAPIWLFALYAAVLRRPVATVLGTAAAMALKLRWIDAIVRRTGVTDEAPNA